MDYIILGLLMLREQTIYDVRKSLRQSISLFYSDSTGGIQAASSVNG